MAFDLKGDGERQAQHDSTRPTKLDYEDRGLEELLDIAAYNKWAKREERRHLGRGKKKKAVC